MSSAEGDNNNVPEAQDGEALQALFAKQCDKDGLMTKQMLKGIPAIQELLVRVCVLRYNVGVGGGGDVGPVMNTLCSRITPRKNKMQDTTYHMILRSMNYMQ